jgi:hypothetical protein
MGFPLVFVGEGGAAELVKRLPGQLLDSLPDRFEVVHGWFPVRLF